MFPDYLEPMTRSWDGSRTMIASSGFIIPMRTRAITDEIAHKAQNMR